MPAGFGGVIKQLRKKEQNLSRELGRVRQAIEVLTSIGGRGPVPARVSRPTDQVGGRRRRRRMSAAARAKISVAQKRRWAKQKAKA